MNSIRTLFLTLAVTLLVGCTAVQHSQRYYEPQEAAIRQLLNDSHGAAVILVAFGTDRAGNYIDPPADFMRRLADLPKPAKPASAGDYNETLHHNRLSGFRDRATRKHAWLYSITLKRSFSPNKAELVVVSSDGGLSGGELTFNATRDSKGHWTVERPQVSAIF